MTEPYRTVENKKVLLFFPGVGLLTVSGSIATKGNLFKADVHAMIEKGIDYEQ